MVAQPSSALAQDIRILEYMAVKNGLLTSHDLNTSFASNPSTWKPPGKVFQECNNHEQTNQIYN
jgi:hypothetical protein